MIPEVSHKVCDATILSQVGALSHQVTPYAQSWNRWAKFRLRQAARQMPTPPLNRTLLAKQHRGTDNENAVRRLYRLQLNQASGNGVIEPVGDRVDQSS